MTLCNTNCQCFAFGSITLKTTIMSFIFLFKQINVFERKQIIVEINYSYQQKPHRKV